MSNERFPLHDYYAAPLLASLAASTDLSDEDLAEETIRIVDVYLAKRSERCKAADRIRLQRQFQVLVKPEGG